MDKAIKITGIYERKLIRKLIVTDQQTTAVYNLFIEKVSPILSQYRANLKGVAIRVPELDRQLNAAVKSFQSDLEKVIVSNKAWAWAQAEAKNDIIISDFIQKLPAAKIAKQGLFKRNIDAFTEFQKRKYNGLNLSKRVWNLAETNKNLLNTFLDNGLMTGKSANEIAREVKYLLNDPGKAFRRVRDENGNLKLSKPSEQYHPGRGRYRSSLQNARRLARTEVNMAYRTSDQERWKATSFILGYQVKLSARHNIFDICDSAQGVYPKNFKFVGWHPQCLCYTVPILPTDEQMDAFLSGEKDLPTNYVNDIPDDMKKYIEENKERISNYKDQPYWVQDNFKGKHISGEIKF